MLGVDAIEYLPIWLCDHKHEISSKDYTICNVLNKVDIVDMDKSDIREWMILDEDQIYGFSKLVVDYEAIPEGAKMFRASKKLDQIFINDDVKQASRKSRYRGLCCERSRRLERTLMAYWSLNQVVYLMLTSTASIR